MLSDVRGTLWQCYGWAGPVFSIAALLSTLVAIARFWRRSERWAQLLWLIGCAGGIAALALVAALVDVTSFPALHVMYLGSAVPLIIVSWIVAPLIAFRAHPSPSATE